METSKVYSVNERIARSVNCDTARLLVSGLSQQTTSDTIKQYFSQFGEVKDAIVLKEKQFGFVTYKESPTAHFVSTLVHVIDGHKLKIQKARPKPDNNPIINQKNFKTPKIFVGGLPKDLTLQELKDYFTTFGEVVNCIIIPNKNQDNENANRGFGFVQFSDCDVVETIMQNYFNIKIKGKWIECKKAIPKEVFDDSNAKKQTEKFESEKCSRFDNKENVRNSGNRLNLYDQMSKANFVQKTEPDISKRLVFSNLNISPYKNHIKLQRPTPCDSSEKSNAFTKEQFLKIQERNIDQRLKQNSGQESFQNIKNENSQKSSIEKIDSERKRLTYESDESDLELEKLSQDSNEENTQSEAARFTFEKIEGFSEADYEDDVDSKFLQNNKMGLQTRLENRRSFKPF